MTNKTEQQAVPVAQEAFLDQLRRVNLARYEAWIEGADAGIMFDALELGGEVGELLNVVKKLEREERGWRGSRASPEDFADECADVLICLDKLARRKGVDLAAATIAKFNATSEKVDLPHRLSGPDATQTREAEGDTVKFVQDWLMNADYDPTQFDKDFAAAIDARKMLTDAELQAAAERFCATPLPETVCADLVAIKQMPGRTGTNLMTVAEAKEMLRAALNARGGA